MAGPIKRVKKSTGKTVSGQYIASLNMAGFQNEKILESPGKFLAAHYVFVFFEISDVQKIEIKQSPYIILL